jgi:DNA-binding MarR family transcriptional regulator
MSSVPRSEARLAASGGTLDRPWQTLRETHRLLRERWTQALQQFDLSFSDFVVLDLCVRTLAKASDVARAIGVTAAGATDVIDRLEARHLVRRVPDASDRRVVLIHITAAGERMLAHSNSVKNALLSYLTHAMTASERQALADGLEALRRALRDAPGKF